MAYKEYFHLTTLRLAQRMDSMLPLIAQFLLAPVLAFAALYYLENYYNPAHYPPPQRNAAAADERRDGIS